MSSRGVALWSVLLTAGCASLGARQGVDREHRWVTSVLLGSEVGDERQAVVRWRRPVHYLVVGADVRQRHACRAALAELRAALEDLHEFVVEFVGRDDARLGHNGYVSMFFTAPRAAGGLVRRYGALEPGDDADGWFTITWNGRYELVRATVFVDPLLSDDWLAHTVLEEMVQVVGLSNDSPLFADSIVFEGEHAAGSGRSLSDRDRQLLRLLYGQLAPGQPKAAVLRAVRRTWPAGRP